MQQMLRLFRFSIFYLAFFLIAPASRHFRFTYIASATLHHKWKAMTNAFRSMQEVMLQTSLDRAQLNYGIIFECRTTSNRKFGDEVHFGLQLGDMRGFKRLDPRRKLALFLHGWNDEGSKQWVQEMLIAWTHWQPNYSVCVVDWGHLSQLDYTTASMSIFDVGLTVAGIIMALEKLRPRYFTRHNVTIAGYSLGAHAAGHAGAMLGGEVEQIIGLDPAGPLFTMPAIVSPKYRLDPTDAEFVQVLHTASGTLGTSLKSGHADFYPNGGKPPQSNCLIKYVNFKDLSSTNPIACSHSTAALFFKQSMDPEYPFVGFHCKSYDKFKAGRCLGNRRGRFGIHSRQEVYGNFYFKTLPKKPYVQRRETTGNSLRGTSRGVSSGKSRGKSRGTSRSSTRGPSRATSVHRNQLLRYRTYCCHTRFVI